MPQALLATENRTTIPREVGLRLLFGGGVFWVAYDHGSYTLAQYSAVGVVVWWGILVGVIAGVLVARFSHSASTAVLGLLGLAAVELVSVLWSHDPDSALAEFDRVLVYVGILVLVVAIATRFGIDAPADGLTLGISAIAILALMSRFFPGIGADRVTPAFASFSSDRLSYPLDYWNGLAIFAGLGVPLLLRRASEPGSVIARATAAGVLPVVVAVIYLASSRGGIAVACVGTLVFIGTTCRRWRGLTALALSGSAGAVGLVALRRWPLLVDGQLNGPGVRAQGHHAAVVYLSVFVGTAATQALITRFEPAKPCSHARLGRGLVLASILAAAVGLATVHPIALAQRFARHPQAVDTTNGFVTGHLSAINGSGRWQLWTAALDEWRSHPVVGGGAGSFYRWWLQHGSLALQVRDAHSLYLETMGELGVLGLLLVLTALVPGIVVGARHLRAASPERRTLTAALLGAAAGFAVGLGIDWIWQLAVVGGAGIAILGLLLALASPSHEKQLGTARRGLVALASLLAALVLLGSLLTELRLEQSQAAAGRFDLRAALTAARGARMLEPWSAKPDLELALVYEQAGQLGKAQGEIAAALRKERRDWQLWLVDARIELKLGHLTASRASLRRAAYLNPNSGLFAEVVPLPF